MYFLCSGLRLAALYSPSAVIRGEFEVIGRALTESN